MSDTCSICLDPLNNGTAKYTAECNHVFHFSCIREAYLQKNLVCPLCRARMNTPPIFQKEVVIPDHMQQEDVIIQLTPELRNLTQLGLNLNQLSCSIPPNLTQQEFYCSDNHKDKILATTLCERTTVKYNETRSLLAMVKLTALEKDDAGRTPVDIVAVVDVSGSMEGKKIRELRSTLKYVAQELTNKDRLSIVSFSSSSKIVTNLKCMTPENKINISNIVDKELESYGGTNIRSGIKKGFKVLNNARSRNPVSVMLLLTDGIDNLTERDTGPIVNSGMPEGLMISTFGYGKDHNSRLLASLAEKTSASFTFIETDDKIQEAFERVIVGVTSMCVQDIKIILPPEVTKVIGRDSEICEVQGYRCTCVKIPNIFECEERDILFMIDIESWSRDFRGEINISYIDPDIQRLREFTCTLIVKHTQEDFEETIPLTLDVQRNRCTAVDTIKEATELADVGEYKDAQKKLEETISFIEKSASHDEYLSMALVEDLRIMISRFENYNSYEMQGGQNYIRSAFNAHRVQRLTSITTCYSSPSTRRNDE